MWKTVKQFYNSSEWQKFRLYIIAERSQEHDGQIICEYCGKAISSSGDAEIDHIKELSIENVNDYNISLNPDNVKISCHRCHDRKHERFGTHAERNIYIVYGPPFAGKKSYVKENMRRGDLIVDMDRIYSAISFFNLYDKPEVLKYNAFAIKNLLIDNIKTRYGKFRNAWIIGGYANKHDREHLAEDLGAKLIFINATKEECLKRLDNINDVRKYMKNEWGGYIEKWFDEYQE